MNKILTYFVLLLPIITFGQYPFEKFKSPKKYESLEFKMQENENELTYSRNINSFFKDKTDLEISINGNTKIYKGTSIQIKTSQNIQKYSEEIPAQGIDGLYVADFNGDGLTDIKIVCFYMGSGLASMNVRAIYFFQKKNKEFVKISFKDKMDGNRLERDLNADGNYEIITMTLQGDNGHNYWLFNLYNFKNDNLVCVNKSVKYPIMTAYLYRNNFKITSKLTRKEMKKYELTKPEDLIIEN